MRPLLHHGHHPLSALPTALAARSLFSGMLRRERGSWFEKLVGFKESDYEETQGKLEVEGTRLRSRVNGKDYEVGTFETPTLGDLRARAAPHLKGPGTLRVKHIAVGDILEYHARAENEGALFQVASQFNCLEFVDPTTIPETGVTNYVLDGTQGPACALAAGPATIYRNYFAPVGQHGRPGQTAQMQINNLDAVERLVGNNREGYWTVRNGYTHATREGLRRFKQSLGGQDRDTLVSAVKIGVQRGVEVTLAKRWEAPRRRQFVTQVFCSAVSCGFSNTTSPDWQPLARIALDGAYEATLMAAVINCTDQRRRETSHATESNTKAELQDKASNSLGMLSCDPPPCGQGGSCQATTSRDRDGSHSESDGMASVMPCSNTGRVLGRKGALPRGATAGPAIKGQGHDSTHGAVPNDEGQGHGSKPSAVACCDPASGGGTPAASGSRPQCASSRRVFLTFLGGGVFSNRRLWIADAIGAALAAVDGANLEVFVCHYRRIDKEMVKMINNARKWRVSRQKATPTQQF
eukprot:m.86510 g.86510  ORF g.86510 m.86510 type:complete len:523 (+) comp14879_c0_seq1:45-1613(+)